MPAMVRVREAVAEDWPRVAELLAELGRPAVVGEPGEAEHRAAFVRYLARPKTALLVAIEDDLIVGVCDVEFRQRLNFLEPQAWIPDLIVAGDSRSRGAGAALVARAEELAREHGCWGISLESATWRTRAHDFYRREGYSDIGLAFNKSLDGRPWPPAPRP